MKDPKNKLPAIKTSPKNEAIRHFKQAIKGGKHWYIALLEAIGLWTESAETLNGRYYQYLIAGEAFDWLLLAERLCQTADGILPEEEKLALLFNGRPPLKLTRGKLKELIGSKKYNQYLNYFYGIIVEEALINTVTEEVRKEKRISGYNNENNLTNEVFRRIYGETKDELLKSFRKESGYPQRRSLSLTQLKEFTYWLFKYRLLHCDKARIASDTKKALEKLTEGELPKKLDKLDFVLRIY